MRWCHGTILAALVCLGVLTPGRLAAADAAKVVRTARSGAWSAGNTWEGGRVPSTGVKVLIRAGHAVRYDVKSEAVLRSLHIAGVLYFAHDQDTELNVGLIKIQHGENLDEDGFECKTHPKEQSRSDTSVKQLSGFSAPGLCCAGKPSLLVGTPEQPIAAGATARIRLHYLAGMNKESCPAIVCCGGRMDFHGQPLSHTWVKLGANADAGEDKLVASKTVADWKVDDRILITGSYGNFGGRRPQTEERRITAVHGSRLTLNEPLHHYHRGEGELRAEVANLSRNVVVESADPEGVRGHTMYHVGSSGSIGYAEFRHLGKRGVLGRYPVHYHLCKDTLRGSSVVGASIWDSDNRWLTLHGTEYIVVRDCVGYKSVGHGFFLEDGTEVDNVLDHNLAVLANAGEPLPGQMLPFDKNEGAGFWWANSHNTFTRNVAVDCAGYGFRYEATPRAGFKQGEARFGEPNRIFDLRLPVLQPDGRRAPRDIRTLPFVRFGGNEAHNIANYGLNLGQDAGEVGPDKDHPFVIRDMKIWNAQRGYTVHVPHVRIEGMLIHRCGYEIYRARYRAQDYRGVRLSGIRGKGYVSNLEEYLATGALVKEPGVGLNRARLPGFPRGTGAGGTPYRPANYEVAVLEPVDDSPPITVITHVREEGNKLLVRGTTSDNGKLARIVVNGHKAHLVSSTSGEWEVLLDGLQPGVLILSAHAEDSAGNVEQTRHQLRVVIR
jgi:hypothetical protein